jgi:hypothetical protein
MLQQKFTSNWCRCCRPFFYLLPCQSLSLSLLLLQSTKHNALSLRFHEHMMTILFMKTKMSKIR